MTKELEALNVLCSQIETEMGSDEYYKWKEARNIIEKELEAYSKLKEIIKDKIGELNKYIDEMDKNIEENEYAFADEDFKADYDYNETKLVTLEFVLETMAELEKEVLKNEK